MEHLFCCIVITSTERFTFTTNKKLNDDNKRQEFLKEG